jgi:hypothetical protein
LVPREKVLRCLVSKKGIKANPEKNQCSSTHEAFTIKKKEVQNLIGRIAALSRFMSKLEKRILPFFTVLRGSGSF